MISFFMKPFIRAAVLAVAGALFSAAVSAQTSSRLTTAEYVSRYKHIAVEHQQRYGIPASITLAQGILESDSGNGRLAVEANNHFGIKCKRDWTGMTISHDDDARGECFRKYYSVEDSFTDHAEYLDSQPRYDSLFRYSETDYEHWARGLKAAGYATDPAYADKLIRIIEENKLFLYDTGGEAVDVAVADAGVAERIAADTRATGSTVDIDDYTVTVNPYKGYVVRTVNGAEYVEAGENDSYENIALVFGRKARKLYKFNEAAAGSRPAAGERVFLQRKLGRYGGNAIYHTVAEGETLRSVSQSYGIRADKLAMINRLRADAKLTPGQHLRLK